MFTCSIPDRVAVPELLSFFEFGRSELSVGVEVGDELLDLLRGGFV